MAEQKIIIPFNRKALDILFDIEKKYNLNETHQEAFKRLQENKLSKTNTVVKLTKDLMLEKISNKEFLDNLHIELGTSKETTKNIALDVVNNLIPVLEKIPEDQLEEYNKKKREEKRKIQEDLEISKNKNSVQEALLEKIKTNTSITAPEEREAPTLNLKKVPITDVEKNAETIQHAQQRKETPPPLPPPPPPTESPKSKGVDPYKESLD